jgi:O-antigen/teichoic acid export membrane protein
MQKKFLSSLGWLLLLNLIIKPLWILGIDRAVQNTVAPGAYGIYFALYNFSFLLNILLDVGITNFNNKNIAQHQYLVAKHFSSVLVLKLLLGIVYFAATLITGLLVGYRNIYVVLLAVLALNQFFISLILYLRSNLSGLHLFKTDAVISVLDRLIMIGICSAMLWIPGLVEHFSIQHFILAQTLSYAITVAATLLLVMNRIKTKKVKWNFHFSLAILRKSYPYAILVLLMTFYNRIDGVMLERMSDQGPAQASYYAGAYRLLDAGNMIAYLFAGLLLPLFSRMLKHRESIDALVGLSFSFLFFISFTSAVAGSFFSSSLMEALYPKHSLHIAPVFSVLIFCFIFSSSSYVFGTLLTANGNLRELNLMAFFGMLLNICLNLYLIPRYQALGSACSSLITQGITAGIQVWLCYRKLNIRLGKWYFTGMVAFSLLCTATASYFALWAGMHWVSALFCFAAASLFWAISVKLIRPKGLLNILRSRE